MSYPVRPSLMMLTMLVRGIAEANGLRLCSCGWTLPRDLMPVDPLVREGRLDGENSPILPDAAAKLLCPICDRPHMFVSVPLAKKIGVFAEILAKDGPPCPPNEETTEPGPNS